MWARKHGSGGGDGTPNQLDIFTVRKHFLNIKFKISLIKNRSPMESGRREEKEREKTPPECPGKTNYNFPTSGIYVCLSPEGRKYANTFDDKGKSPNATRNY